MQFFNLPDLGEGLAEAEIIRWHVKAGDTIEVDQPMLAVETAKAVVEVPAPYAGVIRATHGQPGDLVATGSLLVEFERQDDAGTVVGSMPMSDTDFVDVQTHDGVEQSNTVMSRSSGGGSRAVPAARALAKRLGIDLERIRGTGRGGLVTIDDVVNVSTAAAAPRGSSASAPSPPRPPAATPGETEKLHGPRRAMSHSMALARDNVMGCTLFDDADVHSWQEGEDITMRLLRAIAEACAAEPGLNAWFDSDAQTRRMLGRIDVALAVDTPDGLIVPVIRDISGRPVAELRQNIDRLKRSTRDRSIAPEELRDFTFMLSNFGMIAGRYATPVVVPPAVAILGSGRLSHDAVVVNGGKIEAHLRMPLSLTFDHRCVTGGEAARFMSALIRDLQKGS